MLPLEIREERFRLQKQIAALGEGPERERLEQRVAALQEICPHAHPEEDPEQGWRCRDCDLRRPAEPSDGVPAEAAGTAGAEQTQADA